MDWDLERALGVVSCYAVFADLSSKKTAGVAAREAGVSFAQA